LTACPTSTGAITTFLVAWATDGSGFFYIGAASDDHLDEAGQHIWFVSSDGSTINEIWDNSPNNIQNLLRVSPDGTRILFQTDDDVHVVNSDGSGGHIDLTTGTLPGGVHAEMGWKIDSTQVAVNSRPGGLDSVVLIDVPSGDQTVLYATASVDEFFSGMLYYD
jgi:hypothetical protein